MSHSETFHPDAGFQLTFEGKSLLLQMTAISRRFSTRHRAAVATAAAGFLSRIGHKPALGSSRPRELRAADFPAVHGTAFKIVRPEIEPMLRNGSFRLGSPTYYANLGTDPGADGWEGFTSVFVDYADSTFSSAVTTGYNCVAFCTTRARDHGRLRHLREKFGGPDGRVIKITDMDGLARVLASHLPGGEASIRDVRYNDAKFIHLAAERYAALEALLMSAPPPHDLTLEALHELNEAFAPLIHRDALLGSMFVKPVAYAAEQERRLLVELPADVPSPHYVDVVAPEALQFLTFES